MPLKKRRTVMSRLISAGIVIVHPLISFYRARFDQLKIGQKVKVVAGKHDRRRAKILGYYEFNFYEVRISNGVGKRTLHRNQLKKISNG